MRKSWRCRIGWHRYAWLVVSHTCELWVCGCGRIVLQFADDPLALSEVELLNEWLKKPSAKENR